MRQYSDCNLETLCLYQLQYPVEKLVCPREVSIPFFLYDMSVQWRRIPKQTERKKMGNKIEGEPLESNQANRPHVGSKMIKPGSFWSDEKERV